MRPQRPRECPARLRPPTGLLAYLALTLVITMLAAGCTGSAKALPSPTTNPFFTSRFVAHLRDCSDN